MPGDGLVITRALHEGATLLLFGALVFVAVVAPPAGNGEGSTAAAQDPQSTAAARALARRIGALAGASLVVSLVTALVWFALEAERMSGLPFPDAAGSGALGVVATQTLFGGVWVLRFVAGLVLGVSMVVFRGRIFGAARVEAGRRSDAPLAATQARTGALILVPAAAYLGSLSLVGHAVGGVGAARWIDIGADTAHLLAAGAWLGALPGLAWLLGIARRAGSEALIDAAARATRRFSVLGGACVAILVVSGAVNAWHLVGSVPALVGTGYGRMLLAKLGLFAAMLALAADNRLRVAARVERHDLRALRTLARSAAVELALGLGIVIIVGRLGISTPAAEQPRSQWSPLVFASRVALP
jgi:putative copper resistance protein D